MAAAPPAGRQTQKEMRAQIPDLGSLVPNQAPPQCFCYIVECADGTFYTGWTTNLERRVAAHNAGRGSRYTRSRRPVKLVYAESCSGRAEAMRREATLKRMSRPAKLDRIEKFKARASA
jgi:putative endonuclease